MLVNTMTNAEVDAEVRRDYDRLLSTSYDRVLDGYNRERKKLKIAKEKSFARAYPIKTSAKNLWMIMLQKSPSINRYRNESDAVGCGVVYYFSKAGLKMFRPQVKNQFMEVFYGHFFTRYNERMRLNLDSHIEIMKTFFSNCGYLKAETRTEKGKKLTSAICRDGLALGEYYTEEKWLVHKTFISHGQKRPDQVADEERLVARAQAELINKLVDEDNANDFSYLQDRAILAQILGDDHPLISAVRKAG
jgi:hypothetical protein